MFFHLEFFEPCSLVLLNFFTPYFFSKHHEIRYYLYPKYINFRSFVAPGKRFTAQSYLYNLELHNKDFIHLQYFYSILSGCHQNYQEITKCNITQYKFVFFIYNKDYTNYSIQFVICFLFCFKK